MPSWPETLAFATQAEALSSTPSGAARAELRLRELREPRITVCLQSTTARIALAGVGSRRE
jgi:hypothetical protein